MKENTETEMVWVSVGSHRARGRLRRTVGDTGHSYGRRGDWVGGNGEYYQVPAQHADALRRIRGLTVMRGAPDHGKPLFRYFTSAELGGPVS
jgi:hypothetical protein